MNKHILLWTGLLGLTAHLAWAASMPIEEKARAQAAVYKESLILTDDQAASVTEALTDKLTVGKEAHALKKDGDEVGAKNLNREAGKKFQEALMAILTKEQKATWKANKEAIMEKVRAVQ